MYKLLQPKFKFQLYILEQSKFKPTNTQSGSITCHADIYEINADGSITFYQTGHSPAENKKVKIPVLSYPSGRWESCVLLDDQHQMPVFSSHSVSISTSVASRPQNSMPKNQIENDLDNLENAFDTSNQTPNQPSYSNISYHSQMNGMPGVSNYNPEEYKKMKNDLLEIHIKEYVKENDRFDMDIFMPIISSKAKEANIPKVTETDVAWVASSLIKSKAVLARKFSDPMIQRTLSIILPEIMKRHWQGKMSTIIQVLQDKEETKNADAIDLAVWMVQNSFAE